MHVLETSRFIDQKTHDFALRLLQGIKSVRAITYATG